MHPPEGIIPYPLDPATAPHGPLMLYTTQVVPKLEVQAMRYASDPERGGYTTLWEEWIFLTAPFIRTGEDRRLHCYAWVVSSEERDRNERYQGPVYRNKYRKMVRLSDYGVHHPQHGRRYAGYDRCLVIIRYPHLSRAEIRARK